MVSVYVVMYKATSELNSIANKICYNRCFMSDKVIKGVLLNIVIMSLIVSHNIR